MTVHVEAGRTLVVLAGELDPDACPGLTDTLASVEGWVLLDAAGVTFVSSTGLSVLVALANRVEGGGGQLWLRNPSPVLSRLLRVAALEDRFPVEP